MLSGGQNYSPGRYEEICGFSNTKHDHLFDALESADTTYDFGYRRPFLRTQNCKEEEKFYRQMTKGSKTIRLVGMSSEIEEEKNNLSSYPSNKICQFNF